MIDVVVETFEEVPENFRYVIFADGRRVSSAIVSEITDQLVYVHTLGTDEAYRRRGYARAIMQTIQRDYQTVTLDVFRLNEDARALYDQLGFYDCDAADNGDIIRHYRWDASHDND